MAHLNKKFLVNTYKGQLNILKFSLRFKKRNDFTKEKMKGTKNDSTLAIIVNLCHFDCLKVCPKYSSA